MKFLIDENLPPRLARWFCENGFDAVHVRDADLIGKPDPEIAFFAINAGRTIVTRDRDFEHLQSSGMPCVLLIKIGNISTPRLLLWIASRWDSTIRALESGEAYVEVS